MHILVGVLGLALLFAILWDAFESLILPRHVRRSFRIARFFYRTAWKIWMIIARQVRHIKRRESYLSYFGPLSLLLLIIGQNVSVMQSSLSSVTMSKARLAPLYCTAFLRLCS